MLWLLKIISDEICVSVCVMLGRLLWKVLMCWCLLVKCCVCCVFSFGGGFSLIRC